MFNEGMGSDGQLLLKVVEELKVVNREWGSLGFNMGGNVCQVRKFEFLTNGLFGHSWASRK